MNKDLCSIYLCDYLPLTNNAQMINELTINDKSSKYSKNYMNDLNNKCLNIRNKFFGTDLLEDFIYPINSFKYKNIGPSYAKVNKPTTIHKTIKRPNKNRINQYKEYHLKIKTLTNWTRQVQGK